MVNIHSVVLLRHKERKKNKQTDLSFAGKSMELKTIILREVKARFRKPRIACFLYDVGYKQNKREREGRRVLNKREGIGGVDRDDTER